jgi:hypothetical protein
MLLAWYVDMDSQYLGLMVGLMHEHVVVGQLRFEAMHRNISSKYPVSPLKPILCAEVAHQLNL